MKKFFKRRQRRIMFGVLSCMGIAAVALPSHALAIDKDTKIVVGSALGAGAVAGLGYAAYKNYQASKVSARSGSSSQGDGYAELEQLPAIKSPPVPTASDSGIDYSNTRNIETTGPSSGSDYMPESPMSSSRNLFGAQKPSAKALAEQQKQADTKAAHMSNEELEARQAALEQKAANGGKLTAAEEMEQKAVNHELGLKAEVDQQQAYVNAEQQKQADTKAAHMSNEELEERQAALEQKAANGGKLTAAEEMEQKAVNHELGLKAGVDQQQAYEKAGRMSNEALEERQAALEQKAANGGKLTAAEEMEQKAVKSELDSRKNGDQSSGEPSNPSEEIATAPATSGPGALQALEQTVEQKRIAGQRNNITQQDQQAENARTTNSPENDSDNNEEQAPLEE